MNLRNFLAKVLQTEQTFLYWIVSKAYYLLREDTEKLVFLTYDTSH